MAESTHDRAPRWLWALVVMAVLGLAGGGYWWLSYPDTTREDRPPAEQAPLVQTVTVEAAPTVILRQTGFVRAADEVDVVPQITERITTVGPHFQVGETIAEGELLVAFNDTQFTADLVEAQARFDQAQAALQETRLTLERQQELAARDFASAAALEDAEVATAQAEADLAMARAGLRRATSARDDTRVTAPFDAIVTAQAASPGQFVAAGTAIGHLIATESVEIQFALLPLDMATLGRAEDAIGLDVALTDPLTGQSLAVTAEVTGVVPVINAQTRTMDLLIRIDAPFVASRDHAAIRVGELVEMAISVPLGDIQAVRVPAEAVKGNSTVWRIENGQLTPLSVEVIARGEAGVVITHPDIADGDAILLSDLVAPAQGREVRVADQPRDDTMAQGG